MEPEIERLMETIGSLGISLFGTADISSWDSDKLVSETVPVERRPDAIMPGCKSAIVIGIHMQPTVLATAPSIYYRELYKVVNGILDTSAQRIVMELEAMGHQAVFIPRDGYHGIKGLLKDPTSFFSHKHAAYLAGLGTFGVNNIILTKEFGPRVRFTTILTDAVLPYGKPMEKDLCTRCMRCRDECPASAIGSDVYPISKIDKVACTRRSEALSAEGISPCGKCIAVCPIGKDRMHPPTDAAIENIRKYKI